MKYYTISGPNDRVLVIFRVNDAGIPEEWVGAVKTWMYRPYLWEFITYNCHYSSDEITATRAVEIGGIAL